MNKYFGVDPGLEAGWACVSEQGQLIAAGSIPTIGEGTKRTVSASLFADLVLRQEPTHVCVELVTAMKGWGSSSTFRFGVATGIAIGVVGALKLPISFVAPGSWKRRFNLIGQPKEMSRVRAVEIWPDLATAYFHAKRDTHKAEASLIALWAVRVAAEASGSEAA